MLNSTSRTEGALSMRPFRKDGRREAVAISSLPTNFSARVA